MSDQVRLQLFIRYLLRAGAIAESGELSKESKRVYSDVLAPVADTYIKAYEAVIAAKDAVAEKNGQVQQGLVVFDGPYRITRSIVLAFLPKKWLPETLKVQRTETDMLYALTSLVSIVKSNAGQPWADDIMSGQFGTLAPKMEQSLNELAAATIALAGARRQRRKAYGPAYHGYLVFKRVVRDVLGPSSPEYRQLHSRAAGSEPIEPAEEAEPADEAAPDSGVMPASKGTPVRVSEPPSVKAG